jgi:hypothetical protein
MFTSDTVTLIVDAENNVLGDSPESPFGQAVARRFGDPHDVVG